MKHIGRTFASLKKGDAVMVYKGKDARPVPDEITDKVELSNATYMFKLKKHDDFVINIADLHLTHKMVQKDMEVWVQ